MNTSRDNTETTQLLRSVEGDNDERKYDAVIHFGKIFTTLSMIGAVSLLGFLAWSGNNRNSAVLRQGALKKPLLSTEMKSETEALTANAVSVAVTNEYSNRPGFQMFDYPFLRDAVLMEPYRESTVTVSGLPSECGFRWSLWQEGSDDSTSEKLVEVASGSSNDASSPFTVEAGGAGRYELHVKADCADSGVSSSYKFGVWVKYVRRELMSLTESDREEFLDAMKVLWEVNTIDGQALYGEDYKSIQYLAMIHNDGGASGYCDEFHGGPGFLNNHVMLGAYMEQSLQLVNKRTCLHYMEYTKYFEMDSFNVDHRLNSNDGGAWTEMMTEKWFGTNDPFTGRILNGRWANTPVPYLDEAFFHDHGIDKYRIFFPQNKANWLEGNDTYHYFNPYGLLRSPWNFSPDPFLMRFNNVDRLASTTDIADNVYKTYNGVHCEDYEAFLQASVVGKPLQELMVAMEDGTHGNAHFTFGGAGGQPYAENDDKLRELFNFTDADLMETSNFLKRKIFVTEWLRGEDTYFTCSQFPYYYESGALSTRAGPGMEGGMKCEMNPYYLESEDRMDEFLSSTYSTGPDSSILPRLLELSASEKTELLQLLASRYQYDADLSTSSACLDPIFWVLHGALERFFQRVMFENVLSDMEYTYDSDCSGHSYKGTKQWLEGFHFQDRSIDASKITNKEFVDILNPLGDKFANYLNFVYESNSWDWCPGFDTYFESR